MTPLLDMPNLPPIPWAGKKGLLMREVISASY
jgi:hypothetical protein